MCSPYTIGFIIVCFWTVTRLVDRPLSHSLFNPVCTFHNFLFKNFFHSIGAQHYIVKYIRRGRQICNKNITRGQTDPGYRLFKLSAIFLCIYQNKEKNIGYINLQTIEVWRNIKTMPYWDLNMKIYLWMFDICQLQGRCHTLSHIWVRCSDFGAFKTE